MLALQFFIEPQSTQSTQRNESFKELLREIHTSHFSKLPTCVAVRLVVRHRTHKNQTLSRKTCRQTLP
jgi:hypothetical protein